MYNPALRNDHYVNIYVGKDLNFPSIVLPFGVIVSLTGGVSQETAAGHVSSDC